MFFISDDMTEFEIVEVFGIRVTNRCASLLRIICDTDINIRLRRGALEKLGKFGCILALEYIIRNTDIRTDFRNRALEMI